MAINLSSLSNFTTAAAGLSNLVLVTPQSVVGYQPQNPLNKDGSPTREPQPPTLLFNYQGEQTFTFESDITDHYLEDNRAVEDHIALKPEQVSAVGYIGELNNVPPPGLDLLKQVANRLTAVDAYVPGLSTTARTTYNQAFAGYQRFKSIQNTAVSAYSSLKNLSSGASAQTVIGQNGVVIGTSQNKQQLMFQQFYGYWSRKTLFTVQTPWAIIENMAIVSLTARQDEETETISSFEVRFKRIRVAQTLRQEVNFGANALDGRSAAQGASLTDFGTQTPTSSTSLSSGISSMFA